MTEEVRKERIETEGDVEGPPASALRFVSAVTLRGGGRAAALTGCAGMAP